MQEEFSRLELLLGADAIRRLQDAHVLLLGVGGVGSWAAEALARTAVGHLTLVDFDTVKVSNINRQLPALHSTLGRPKVEVVAQRLLDINPHLDLTALNLHLTPDNLPGLLLQRPWSHVIDAIDERAAKVAALALCARHGIPVVSSMGAARKTSSDGISVVDLSETSGCHLARLVRKALRRLGVTSGIPVVFSPALPDEPQAEATPETPGERRPMGTIAFLPAIFGIKCAEHAVSAILNPNKPHPNTGTPHHAYPESD